MICTVCQEAAVRPPILCDKCGKLVCRRCRTESVSITGAVKVRKSSDLSRAGTRTIICRPCGVSA